MVLADDDGLHTDSVSASPKQLSDMPRSTVEDDSNGQLAGNVNSTQTVTETVTTPKCTVSQHFNGLSFVGGMVFAFGSIAILCFARLLFEHRDDHRYHLL